MVATNGNPRTSSRYECPDCALAPRAHATDVQRVHRAHEVEHALHVLADRDHPARGDLQRREVVGALGRAARQRLAPDGRGLLGVEQERQPAVGVLRRALDALRAERGHEDRDRGALGLVEQLEGLAEAGALALGERELEDAVVDERLAAQPAAEDVDDLAGAAQRLVVGDAVEALDDLRAGRAEADHGAAAGHVVEAGRGLEQGAGGAGVDVEDAGADLDRLGPRGEVAHQRGGVEAVRLRHPDRVQPGLLQPGHLVGGLPRVSGIDERHRELHGSPVRGGSWVGQQ